MITKTTQVVSETGWFLTEERKEFTKKVDGIPAWKRLLLIAASPIKWKRARHCSRAAIIALTRWDDHQLFDACCYMSDCEWADILGLDRPLPKLP